MKPELCEFELQLLRSMCGIDAPMRWGAAVGAALEFLRGARLIVRVDGVWTPTAEGWRGAREAKL